MKKLASLAFLLFLAACGGNSVPDTSTVPGKWHSIGRIHEGNIEVSYDLNSVKRQNQIATLRDRKIVRDPSLERFTDTPVYKTAEGEWEFNCQNRSYRLLKLQLWDMKKNIVAQHEYSNMNQLRPMLIVRDTPTQALFDVACKTTK